MDIHRDFSNTSRVRAYAFCFVFAAISGASGWSAKQSRPTAGGLHSTRHKTIGGASDTVDTAVALASDTTIYSDSAVDSMAAMLPGSPSPVYPPRLFEAGTEGSVVLRFVVDEKGLPGYVQIIKSPDPDFTDAVFRSLDYAKFKPGILRGKPVRQWVKMGFVFKVTHRRIRR